MCKCGCGTCETKITGPLLTESKVKSLLSEGLNHHISNAIPLHETIYRYGSVKHLALIKEARKLYSRNIINLNEYDTELIKTNLGEWGVYEGEAVPLDLPRMNEDRDTPMIMYLLQLKQELRKKGFKVKVGRPSKFDNRIQVQHMEGDLDDLITTLDDMLGKEEYRLVFDTNQPMFEEYTVAGKKVKLNKGKNPNGTDWTVTFPNGKTADLADVLALIKPKPELTKENFSKVSGGIPYKVEGNKAIISTPLPDDAKARIIKRAKENGYSAKPNMSGGVTIFKESFSGFLRNPEDPDSKSFEPTGSVAQFRKELEALFGKFKGDLKNPDFIRGVAQIMVNWKSLLRSQLDEKKKAKAKKKDPPIGKPKRGGSKAYYVYVRDPKTKRIKKVSFGSGGLRAKINNPKARRAFAARHKCSQKNDRTKASYWSCRLPRYAKSLGLGNNKNTFW